MNGRPRGVDPGDRIGPMYDRFAAGLYRYALAILADPASAADVVQQVFVAVLRGRATALESDERYLRRAVRNECFSQFRLKRRRSEDSLNDRLLEHVAADVHPPEERLAIEQAMRALPPEQREVVHLKIFEGLTFQEIAEVADESINTIASRYRYALEKLRSKLAGS